MTTPTLLFIVSASVMIVMVLFRYTEIKIGKKIIPSSVRDGSDKIVLSIAKFFSKIFSSTWNFVISIKNKISHVLFELLLRTWEFIVRKSAKYINMIRGKGVIKNKGSASFFISLMEEKEKSVKK